MPDRVTIRTWFIQEVLPLEGALMRYIHRNWRNPSEADDIRHEVYAKLISAAAEGLPRNTRGLVFTIAKNHMINLARRARIVSFDYVADLEAIDAASEEIAPDRHLSAREELARLREGLGRLPDRVQQVILLRSLEGLTRQETADRVGVSISSVEHDLVYGTRALIDFMMGGQGDFIRAAPSKVRRQGREP
ncbi:RNA polymerase sigma factor [Caulobacter sp. CCH5-E12]|uniref:RNA polymerase sigma factor n=1 Tax=Caulobacter sp. CCH5-E12 TaxID=1768770 RepID=UPI0007857D52|nr:RNA polymerase sigma factor [Caulobacter sp. CCH5-E12]